MSQRRLTYVSRIAPGLSEIDLRRVFSEASLLHRRHDLTGLLGFTGQHFAQVIEGHDDDVEALMLLIVSDTRHEGIHVLCDEAIERREFDRWLALPIHTVELADDIDLWQRTGSGDCEAAKGLRHRMLVQAPPDTQF